MTTGQGLFAGLALVAAAIIVVGFNGAGHAATTGGWRISSGATTFAWKVNADTGETQFCKDAATANCEKVKIP